MSASENKAATAARYQRVYVWELPVRIFHWVNAACILVLCITGFLIGAPSELLHSSEAYNAYWFGIVRFTHMAAGNIFLFNLLFRIYWGFVGNKHARLINFIPLKKKQFVELYEVIVADILLLKLHGPETTGHNALAAITYIVLFLVSLFQAALGFALYAMMSEAWLPHQFTWLTTLFGSEFPVRHIHHILMWFYILFIIVHVYISLYHDYVEGKGGVSSIIGGNKFSTRDKE